MKLVSAWLKIPFWQRVVAGFVLGALASGGRVVVNDDVLRGLRVTPAQLRDWILTQDIAAVEACFDRIPVRAGDGERVAVKLAQSLQRPFTVAGQDVAVAVCVGVAQYPQHGKDADSLLRRALGQAVDGRAIGRSGLSPHAAGAAAANDD